MRHVWGFAAVLLVNGCFEKGGRPLPSPFNPSLRELQGEWKSSCESWGDSEDSGSSRESKIFTHDRVIERYEYSRQVACERVAATLDTVLNITDIGMGEYPRTIDMNRRQMLGTIYDAGLLAEVNTDGDCGVWELGVAKDLAECKNGSGVPEPVTGDFYQIYGISEKTLRFGLLEWDIPYDGATPERRPRTLNDHDVYYRDLAQPQEVLP